MVLLHLTLQSTDVASNTLRMDLPHGITPQVMTLKKSIVVHQHDAANTFKENVIYIDLPFISMNEAVSNNSHNWFPISVNPHQHRTESDYHLRFHSERVEPSFDVSVYKDAAGQPFEFKTDADNFLQEIHLFFEYETQLPIM